MLDIQIKSIANTKKVKIDGHVFTVRRAGAREDLELARIRRQMAKMGTKKKTTDADKDALLLAMDKILSIYEQFFDDGMGGVKTQELFNVLDIDGLAVVYKQIWQENDEQAKE